MSKLTIKVIKRESFPWGIYDEDKKEFVKMFQTKSDAKKGLKDLEDELAEAEQEQE